MPEIDWVNERAACSLKKVFETLKLQVKEDVKARNESRLSPLPNGCKFVVSTSESQFNVSIDRTNEIAKYGQKPLKSALFVLDDKSIKVFDKEEKLMLEADITLNDLGECRVKIKGQERELWQMRREALEDLFFKTV